MPDQRFGHGGAHVVHAHLVAVVGAPAQRQLAQIACAQREAADLVGDVHDDLRAFARLRIFVGDVVHFGILPDILEVLLDSLDDGDGSGRAADQRHQPERVLQRAAARAHAGHGDADQPLHRIARAAERIGGGEQGERRIEAAAHAEHGAPGVHPLHAGQQGGGLNQQDFLRARVPLRTGRHEGQGRDGAQQALVGMRGQLKADGAQGLRCVLGESAALAALEAQALHVHIRDGEGALAGEALVFGEQAAVFVDPGIAGKHQIGGRFAVARARVEIAAQAARALLGDQLAAVAVLGDQLVGGGGVDDHQRAAHAQPRGRRRGHPQILAKLDAEGESAAVEDQIPADGDALAAERHALRRGSPRLKPALFIKLAAVWQMRLGHHAENPPAADRRRAVIQPAADFQRKPDDERRANRRMKQRFKRLQTARQQRGMEQQVGAGVAAETELRKNAKLGALLVRLTQQREDFLRVGLRIGQMDARHGGHRADHAGNMSHKQNSLRKKS